MWSLVSIYSVTVSMSEQDSCTFRVKHTKGQKSFWTHPMILQGDEAQVEARFGSFGDSANLDAR
jgi:ferredoxin-NADP reductase